MCGVPRRNAGNRHTRKRIKTKLYYKKIVEYQKALKYLLTNKIKCYWYSINTRYIDVHSLKRAEPLIRMLIELRLLLVSRLRLKVDILKIYMGGWHCFLTATWDGWNISLTAICNGWHSSLTLAWDGWHSSLMATWDGWHSSLTLTLDGWNSSLTATWMFKNGLGLWMTHFIIFNSFHCFYCWFYALIIPIPTSHHLSAE